MAAQEAGRSLEKYEAFEVRKLQILKGSITKTVPHKKVVHSFLAQIPHS